MPTFFLKTVSYVQRLFRLSEVHLMLLYAGVVGVLGALSTIAFRDGLAAMQHLLVGHSGSFVEMAQTLPWQMRVILPAAGGVIAGLFLVLANRYTAGIKSDYMEAVAVGDGHISVRQTMLRSLSSFSSIVSGGSIGREGAMVQLAAMCASVTGRTVRLEPSRLRLLVACGAAAGLASAYNAPIAGAFFVTEIVLGSIAMASFGPVLVAAVVANITMREFPGYQPAYQMPAFQDIAGVEVLLFIGLGVVAGVAAPQFLRILDGTKKRFQKSGLPLPVRLGIGGLLVGILSVWVPQVWGNGYSVVNSLLHDQWLWTAVLTILVFKLVATALTTGSGAVGGVFTPTLFMGAAMGLLFGQAMQALLPQAVSAPFTYAIVGMGAFLAAATSAPLMAILMIFEMTLSYQVMLPLMLSCVVAYFIARSIDSSSMYEIIIKRNREEQDRLRLRKTQMRELIRPAETVLPLTATLDELTRTFIEHSVKYIYIVNEHNRLQGQVALQDLTSVLTGDPAEQHKTAADYLRRDFLPVITPEMSLSEALQRFLTHQGERLPIVQSIDDPVLLGAIYKTSLLDAYYRLS
ncbi:MAG TPA: ClcB-like voltage-gated chloride channel protein [Oxalicibacterium sp.]|uniref:ClcB-like voltage-gated chloride channel protein n=1 Tax=Oxalicibacterium sp. TaxID=2766525 RepID=UPI002CD0A8AC|nr:ClcB-like voltage-gated chloride channel protein [Oxalicibacterium sp.]HWU97108.1 ClcB-like voltage-gated chloride channel protein [Oxalicibacterium sp.]